MKVGLIIPCYINAVYPEVGIASYKLLKHVDDKGVAYHHEIDEYLYKINYVMNGYGLKNGYVVFGIEDVFK